MKSDLASQTRARAWLERRVIEDGRGDRLTHLEDVAPSDRFWLGRLASEVVTREQIVNERFNRLEPCAIGFTFIPSQPGPWACTARISFRTWTREGDKSSRRYTKSQLIEATVPMVISPVAGIQAIDPTPVNDAIVAVTSGPHRVELSAEVSADDPAQVTFTVVNVTQPLKTREGKTKRGRDVLLYEVRVSLEVPPLTPFLLDDLPDSFRYDRRIWAYGVNAAAVYDGGTLRTEDFAAADTFRPKYWDSEVGAEPDLSFARLAEEPLPILDTLLSNYRRWTEDNWSDAVLAARAEHEGWSEAMLDRARHEAVDARGEVDAVERGLLVLRTQPDVLRAFRLMNEAFVHSGKPKGYTQWRPFQLGFILLSLPGLVSDDPVERGTVDTLWFSTGGGKTETYLGLVVLLTILDRIRGKRHGISAWSRFPLRMLSLQQTQRFADALAGAELVRRREALGGDPIALGYYVGPGTPNKIHLDDFEIEKSGIDFRDPDMPKRYCLLLKCPFCFEDTIEMGFDETSWRLEHRCTNGSCVTSGTALPIYVVDDEIYRTLPAVVVGTLDKAAAIGFNASARGFIGAPHGRCTGPDHGFTYAKRRNAPEGCLVPSCTRPSQPLDQDESPFAPGLRVQDELHLLADSLGAIDAQYETLLDQLTTEAGGTRPKVVGSSATLAGYHDQVAALYRRVGRAFPMPGPVRGRSFWSQDTEVPMRRFVALAPRGQTQDFAVDRIAQSLQLAIRELADRRDVIAPEIGVDVGVVDDLVDLYGTDVFYGSKIPDVEATARSLESQPPVHPTNVERLTGGTPLPRVKEILGRLSTPEPTFEDRVHVICASSMMSHGVDVDRFNVMTILGVPFKTSEFIQTSARIGRRYPGLVFVLHRMVYERDAKVYNAFPTFVRHGDRFVEPIAITRKSRNVLAMTLPGELTSQLLQIAEPRRLAGGGKALSTTRELRRYIAEHGNFSSEMVDALTAASAVDPGTEPALRADIERFVDEALYAFDRATEITYPPQALERTPLRSLRDVEAQIPIRQILPTRG